MNVCKVDASELPNSRWENTGSETPHCIYWILVCRYLFIKMPQVSAALPGLWPLLKGFSSFAYNFYVGVLHDLFWVPCLIFSVDHWEFLCHQLFSSVQFSSVQFSHSVVPDSLWPHESEHTSPPCQSQTPRVYSNTCPLSRWCHPVISSSVFPFSCPQSLPASSTITEDEIPLFCNCSLVISITSFMT